MLRIGFLCFIISFSSLGQSFENEITAHREEYKKAFIEEERSPLDAEGVKMLDFFPSNENYRVNAKIKKVKKGELIEIPTYSGKIKMFQVYARLAFKVNGSKQKLLVYRNTAFTNHPLYSDYLFLPFKDKTSAKETYGGGRYLDFKMKDLSGKRMVLDFNKAYNPYCAYSDGYNCPIPPADNHLEVAILAGEKNYLGKYSSSH